MRSVDNMPKLRFKDDNGKDYPEWGSRTLGDIAKITNGDGDVQDAYKLGLYPFFDRSIDIKYVNEYLFEGESVIYPGEGSEFYPRYFNGKYGLHQRSYAIKDFDKTTVYPKYIYYEMMNKNNYFLSVAVGSTVKSLRMGNFTTCPISLPSLPEQTKIANFLSLYDRKIEKEKAKLEALREQKKGLLQQMFV